MNKLRFFLDKYLNYLIGLILLSNLEEQLLEQKFVEKYWLISSIQIQYLKIFKLV